MFSVAPTWMWAGFGVLVLSIMAFDLGLFSKKDHEVSMKEALGWVSLWATLAMIFNIVVWQLFGGEKGLQFLTGYIIEQALSVDNLFVFIVVFQYFAVPKKLQHRVLFWGVLGAFVLRAIFIFAGVALISRFHWMIYVFGGFLVLTGGKILLAKEDEEEVDPSKSILVRVFRRFVPVSSAYEGSRFFTIENGKRMATPLLLVLFVVEGTDVVFAVDSIPAIFAVTTDPFILYTSNIFAILGLRNLYFVLSSFMDKFEYLKVGLGLVLVFVGVKMVISGVYHVHVGVSLAVIATLLLGSVLASLFKSRHNAAAARQAQPPDAA
jgi:tellurite resistance protein TerC